MSTYNDDTRNKYIQDIIDEVVPKSCQHKITNTGYSLSYEGKSSISHWDFIDSKSWKIEISLSSDLLTIKDKLRELVQNDNCDRDHDSNVAYVRNRLANYQKNRNKEREDMEDMQDMQDRERKRKEHSEAMKRLMKNISIINKAIEKLNKCWLCRFKNRNTEPVAYLEKPSSSATLDEINNTIIDSIEFANALYRKECMLCKWTTELL
jgi:DNA polymerase III delta prime subunit